MSQKAQEIDQKLAEKPEDLSLLLAAGNAWAAAGDLERAEQRYLRMLNITPHQIDALYNLGLLYRRMGRLEFAADCYRRVLEQKPDHTHALNNMANLYNLVGQNQQAEVYYRKCLAIEPNHAEALCNLGRVYYRQNQWELAVQHFRRAIEAKGHYPDAFVNLGVAGFDKGMDEFCLAMHQAALNIDPEHKGAKTARAMIWLLQGDFARGWAEYEARFGSHDGPALRNFPIKRWDGSAQPTHLYVHAEQGLGDSLQFARYLPTLIEAGHRVSFEVQTPLIGLFQQLNAVTLISAQQSKIPSDCGAHIALMSLPYALKTFLPHPPPAAQYLKAKPTHLSKWREILGPRTGKRRIAIGWAGSKSHGRDRLRSIPLSQWSFLKDLTNLEILSAQKDLTEEDQSLLQAWSWADYAHHIQDFDDTAALLDQVDLLLSVDTSLVHLAGSLGVQTLVMLPFAPDWRWGKSGNETIWYPKATLIRQQTFADWSPVFTEVRQRLVG